MLGKEFGGEDVSGGEWQKIAIARVLYKDSELLVLDEPTSALDPLIETEILGKFIDMAKDKTAIIISHRIGLCKLVDKLVVMKDGKIAGYGPHDELIETNTYYRHLFFEQQKWYEN
jgi:ATP-binding cassette subfamily B protein